MTREKLIHLIYTSNDERVCNCNDCLGKKELEDFKVGDCIRCAEKKLDEFLAEHDKQIRAEAISSICNGETFPRLYKIYHGMKQRCNNKKSPNYKYYGGKGICVCEEWNNDFAIFCLWSLRNGYKDGLSIDRINIEGNYEPSNCRWLTQKEQANNRSSNTLYEYEGETHTLSEWAEIKDVVPNTLYGRWQKGWRGEELFQTPKTPNNRKGNRMVSYKGKTQSLAEWSRELNISLQTLSGRIVNRGWNVERAFETPVDTRFHKKAKQLGE